MNLDETKLSALASDHQVALIDTGGALLDSCHSLINLRESIGEPFFDHFAAFTGLQTEVMGLNEDDPELCLPKISAPEFGTDEHLDFRFCFKGEDQPVLLLISAHRSINLHLTEIQQQRNEDAIALEYQSRASASVLAENTSLRSHTSELSHDLHAPLRAISHLASWIEEAVAAGDQDKTSEYVGLMKARTQHMTSLVDALLGNSRAGSSAAAQSTVSPPLAKDLPSQLPHHGHD